MDIIAIVVSICALLVSILSPAFEFYWNKKMNVQNLTAEYFREIYGKIIYEDIPINREYIHFDGNELSGTENLIDTLRTIRGRSVYFKIANNNFYNNLISHLQGLEDYLVQTPNQMTSSQFANFHKKVDEYLEKIYSDISNGYLGKKIRTGN